MTLDHAVPILSLLTALLAVFVGPLVSLKIAERQLEITRRQIESAQRVAVKQVVAPMRQVWINTLRERISAACAEAEYCCYTLSLGQTIPNFPSRARKLYRLQKEITLILNPLEDDHKLLIAHISKMLGCVQRRDPNSFPEALRETMGLTQKILKTEWNRVKGEL